MSNQRKEPILRKNRTGSKAIIHRLADFEQVTELAQILYTESTYLDQLNGTDNSFIAPS